MKKQIGQFGLRHDSSVMAILGGAAVAVALTASSSDARACGACYASSSESTVVNDHKMALSIQKQRTILWDQIAYSGNPKEFAYVIPVKQGTKLEPSNDAWFGALEASTRPIIMAPAPAYGGYGGNDSTSSGCGCGSSTMDAMSSSAGSDGRRENVQVVDQSVVGPYETVTIRSTDPQALEAWLKSHGYAIPANSGPIIASYVEAGLDFIALRLQPGLNVRAMEPIRIVSPGTDAQLPLRMMQIGAGAKVGITLYVIGEGRYHTASFPDVAIDFDKLIWDYGQNRSNYQELSIAAMASKNGRGFITEYADRPSFDEIALPASSGSGMTSNTGLAAAYKAACPTYGTFRPPVEDSGAIPPPFDAGSDAAVDPDAGRRRRRQRCRCEPRRREHGAARRRQAPRIDGVVRRSRRCGRGHGAERRAPRAPARQSSELRSRRHAPPRARAGARQARQRALCKDNGDHPRGARGSPPGVAPAGHLRADRAHGSRRVTPGSSQEEELSKPSLLPQLPRLRAEANCGLRGAADDGGLEE